MSTFHLAEPPFYTLQGEGRYTGVPSVFLRMFGCNFRCRGFNRDLNSIPTDEKYNPEVAEIIKNIDNYKSIKDLPLVATGCDSYLAIYPEFKRFVIKRSTEELIKDIVDLLPWKSWNGQHLVITGGEPLLGWQRLYPELLVNHQMNDLSAITFETNGTQKLSEQFKDYLTLWKKQNKEVTFSVSAKLSCSGELAKDAIKPEIACEYAEVGPTYLKFVVATLDDVKEALRVINDYRFAGFTGDVYLMAVGGVASVHQLNSQTVAELALKYGLRYSDRLQVGLWKNSWGS